jgi:hypothetical protein
MVLGYKYHKFLGVIGSITERLFALYSAECGRSGRLNREEAEGVHVGSYGTCL